MSLERPLSARGSTIQHMPMHKACVTNTIKYVTCMRGDLLGVLFFDVTYFSRKVYRERCDMQNNNMAD